MIIFIIALCILLCVVNSHKKKKKNHDSVQFSVIQPDLVTLNSSLRYVTEGSDVKTLEVASIVEARMCKCTFTYGSRYIANLFNNYT